ncbi:interferon-induced protein with tetratricopeptide repeats 1B-like [Amphiura filiformis]|uniref:interferon-induced protein with tetratricopeptide repeats 1B-like n=1 Tax=Amphiura filiformis TaxID=82378 RepID=UPI003B21BF1A
MEKLPSHFNWNLENGTFKEFSALEQQMTEHIARTKADALARVEGYLFLSFLFMSIYKHLTPDPQSARKYLTLAYDIIGTLERENRSAWLGYRTVAKANEAHIVSRLQGRGRSNSKLQQLKNTVNDLVSMKTKESESYVTATRAFALSRLGIPKYTEATQYYKEALAVEPKNVSWLFRLALIKGRENRYKFGTEQQKLTPEMLDEKRLYEEVIRLEPNHGLALAYLAHLVFMKGDSDIALEYCHEALAVGDSNPCGITLVGDIFRVTKNYDSALDAFKKCEDNGTKSSRLYHHWGLVYLDQFIDIKENNPPEEKSNSNSAYEAIKLFEKALECNPTNCEALLDKARTHELLKDATAATDDFEKLMAMSGISRIDEIKINCHYGLFLHTTGTREIEALERYCTTIECAMEFTERDEQKGNRQRYDMYEGNRFIGKIQKNVRLAVKGLEELVQRIGKTSQYDIAQRCVALKCFAWLQHRYYGRLSDAIKCYEECREMSNNNIDLIDAETDIEILKGLLKCFIRDRNWAKAEELIKEMRKDNLPCAAECEIELRISQGQQASLEENFLEARIQFTEALDDVDGFKGLLMALESSPERDTCTLQFRLDCAKLLFSYKACDAHEIEASLSESRNGCEEFNHKSVPERVDILLGVNHSICGKLRKKHLRMELVILEQGKDDADNQTTLDSASEVLAEVHALPDRVMMDFKAAHFPITKPARCTYYYSPVIEEPMQSIAERANRVKGDILKRFEKDYKWKGFSIKFPELLDYLVKIQPAYDIQNNWIRALAKLDNMAKHQCPIRHAYYDIPRYLLIKNGDNPIPVGKPVDGNDDADEETPDIEDACRGATKNQIHDRYRVRDLARQAAIDVEKIVVEFSNYF